MWGKSTETNSYQAKKETKDPPSTTKKKRKTQNMQLNNIPVYGLLVLLTVQLFSAYPITNGLTRSDIDVLKVSSMRSKAHSL